MGPQVLVGPKHPARPKSHQDCQVGVQPAENPIAKPRKSSFLAMALLIAVQPTYSQACSEELAQLSDCAPQQGPKFGPCRGSTHLRSMRGWRYEWAIINF